MVMPLHGFHGGASGHVPPDRFQIDGAGKRKSQRWKRLLGAFLQLPDALRRSYAQKLMYAACHAHGGGQIAPQRLLTVNFRQTPRFLVVRIVRKPDVIEITVHGDVRKATVRKLLERKRDARFNTRVFDDRAVFVQNQTAAVTDDGGAYLRTTRHKFHFAGRPRGSQRDRNALFLQTLQEIFRVAGNFIEGIQ